MNITSSLKNGIKNIKGKLKIKTTSEGVVVEGKKCKTAKSLFENVKKIAKKDAEKNKSYGFTWNKTATDCRKNILTKSFTADTASENFYKAFIEHFKDKVILPSMLDTFYNNYAKSHTITQDTSLVYLALSFYAISKKSLSHSSKQCPSIEYKGKTFKNPKQLLEETKKEFGKVFKGTIKTHSKIRILIENAEKAAYEANKDVYTKYYGDQSTADQKIKEIMVAIDNAGSIQSGVYRDFYLNGIKKKSITKDTISREIAVFQNFKDNKEQFETALNGASTQADPKIVDINSVTYDCLVLWNNKETLEYTANEYFAAANGEFKETETKLTGEAKDAASKLNLKINQLKEIAAYKGENILTLCENIEKKYKEVFGIKNGSTQEEPIIKTTAKDENKGTGKKRKDLTKSTSF